MAKQRQARVRKGRGSRRSEAMVFGRKNYQLLILGLVLIVVGYIIMRVDNQVDGVVSLFVAPLMILAGYLEIIYAILWRPSDDPSRESSS